MEIRYILGDSSPETFERLEECTFINVQVEEVVTKDGDVRYRYKRLFTNETDEVELEKLKMQFIVHVHKQYLNDTDHKFYVDYEPKVGEDLEALEAIRAKRSEARAFLRANEE